MMEVDVKFAHVISGREEDSGTKVRGRKYSQDRTEQTIPLIYIPKRTRSNLGLEFVQPTRHQF
jgi:hypothetical protein